MGSFDGLEEGGADKLGERDTVRGDARAAAAGLNSGLEGALSHDAKRVPFDIVDAGEQAPDYPARFGDKLEGRWENVCFLMGWPNRGTLSVSGAIGFDDFKKARDPRAVVRDIQQAILDRGGELPKFGADGLFGEETEVGLDAALDQISLDLKAQEAREMADLASNRVGMMESEVRGAEGSRGFDRLKFTGRFQEMMRVIPDVLGKLKAAGLETKGSIFSLHMSDAEIAAYRGRAGALRTQLISEEPRLAALDKIVNGLIDNLKERVGEMDFSKVQNLNDLVRVIEGLVPQMEEDLGVLTNEELDSLIDEVGIEVFTTYFMTVVHEGEVVLSKAMAVHEEQFARIERKLKADFDEGGFDALIPESVPTDETERKFWPGWQELVDRGVVSSGIVRFSFLDGKEVKFDIDHMTVSVDGKKAKLVLPFGLNLNSVQAESDGGINLSFSLGGSYHEKKISQINLGMALVGISIAKKDVPFGNGAFLRPLK